MRIPYFLSLLLGHGYQLASKVTGKPPTLTPSTAKIAARYAYYDCSKAVNELGLPQTPIRTTVEKAITWFRENGYVKGT